MGRKTLCNIILNMVRIVENKIGLDVKKAKRGSTMHDGWSNHCTHRAGLLAFYMGPSKRKVKGKLHAERASVVVSLAVLHLSKLENEPNGELIKILS